MKNSIIKKNKIKALIFDLGNVLIGFDHRIAVKNILRHTRKSKQEIYDLFFDSQLTQDFEKGKISPLDFFEEVKALLGLGISYEAFLPIWNQIFFSHPEVEAFIHSLKFSHRLVLLSNINRLHYEYILDAFPYAIGLFGVGNVVASYTTGLIKPQRRIYELAIEKTGADKEEIVYVDDRSDLIEAAQRYGIRSIQFQGLEHLKQELKKMGVIGEKDKAPKVSMASRAKRAVRE